MCIVCKMCNVQDVQLPGAESVERRQLDLHVDRWEPA